VKDHKIYEDKLKEPYKKLKLAKKVQYLYINILAPWNVQDYVRSFPLIVECLQNMTRLKRLEVNLNGYPGMHYEGRCRIIDQINNLLTCKGKLKLVHALHKLVENYSEYGGFKERRFWAEEDESILRYASDNYKVCVPFLHSELSNFGTP